MALLSAGLLSCGCHTSSRQEVDLVATVGKAIVRRPTTIIEFGTPAARPHLVAGWLNEAPAPMGPGGRLGAIALGRHSELQFFAAPCENLHLTLKAMSQPGCGTKLRVFLDERPVGTVELTQALGKHRLTLPGRLAPGRHRLLFENPECATRRQRSHDARVVWQRLRFLGMPAASEQPVLAETPPDRLTLSAPVRLDYLLEVPGRSSLVAARVARRGGAQLSVRWQPLDPGASPVASDSWSGEALELVPAAGRPRRGRLSFLVSSAQPGSAETATALLERPRVRFQEDRTTRPREAAAPSSGPRAAASRPNIVLYMVDTLRRDRLGCYGYDRPTSPQLDRLCAESVVFDNAVAQSSWTRPSVASVLTGLWPQNHSAVMREDMLPAQADTLQERLRAAGYQTAALVANGNVSEYWGFAQGFDDWLYLGRVRRGEMFTRSGAVHAAFVSWLDSARDTGRPFFVWMLTIDPHGPYQAPEPFHSLFAQGPFDPARGSRERLDHLKDDAAGPSPEVVSELSDLYDAEVRANDESFGAMLAELQRRGLADTTVVVFVSDHGEEFYEHGGWEHGQTLFAEMLDIPLVVHVPGGPRGVRRPELVQHVDLMPTLLDLAGIPWAGPTNGRSLRALLEPGSRVAVPPAAVLSQLDNNGRAALSLVEDDWKLIVDGPQAEAGYARLYYRPDDPGDQNDVNLRHRVRADFMRTRMRALLRSGRTQPIPRATIDPALRRRTEEQLRALGYVR